MNLLAGLFVALSPGPTTSAPSGTVPIRVELGELTASFTDNSERGRLSGIDSLFSTQAPPGFDAFDPDTRGASAGMNFEHIICGHANSHNAFSPRQGPYHLTSLPRGKGVCLTRRAEDDPWRVDSTLTYELSAPHYIDVTFRCRPRDAARFAPEDYAILFFCNYMNDVVDPAIHFRGIQGPGGEEQWVDGDAPPGHPRWNGGGTYIQRDASALPYAPDLRFNLNTWNYEYPRYTLPFYYGRAAHGMVFMLMFDRACTQRDEIRFSLFKFKLKQFPRPAWDFEYVIHHVEQDREYGYRARMVWKRFISADDCLAEYRTWSAGLATRPAAD
jgi:hypothetical protein